MDRIGRIGLQAVFEDAQFQQGLSRYVSGLSRAESATRQTASAMSALGNTISTALGTAIGFLSAQAIPQITGAIMGPINATRTWGEQLDSLGDIFGLTDTAGAGFAIAMKKVGISVDEGAGSFSYFSRQVAATKDQLADAASTYATATGDIASAHADAVNKISRDWQAAQADAADNIATVWRDLAEKRADIEQSEADQIASINEGLQERLSDIADQRAKLDRDTSKSLSKLTEDTRDRLRSARSARERRQIRKDAAERKQEILEEAAERKRELDKQEAREKEHAAKQIALAEKVAQKQIDAAEKAAEKQTAAIEKALAKQQKAMQEQTAEANKQAAKQMQAAAKALSDVSDRSPLSKALKALGLDFKKTTNESRPFEERLGDIMDAFAKLPAGVDASAIAINLFGRAGIKWLDFLRQGRKGLEEAKKLGIDLGLVLDSSQAEQFGRSLNMLQLSFDALGINIGRVVLPVVNELVTGFTQFMNLDLVPAIRKLADRIMTAFKAGGIEGAAGEFWKALTEPSGIFDQLGKLVARIRDWFTNGDGSKILKGAGSAFSAVVSGFNEWAGGPEAQTAITAVTKTIGDAVMAGIQLILAAAEKVAQVMSALTESLLKWVESPAGQTAIEKITQAIAKIVFDSLGKLLSSDERGRTMVQSLGDNLMRAVQNLSSFIARIGGTLAGSLIGGVVSNFVGADTAQRIKQAISDAFTGVIDILIAPGGPLIGLATKLANGFWSAFTSVWSQVTKGWNPLSGISPTTIGSAGGSAGGSSGFFANGGPVRRTGWGHLEAGEWVLNRQQAMMLAPMLTRPNTTSNNITFSHTWNGAPASFDRGEVQRIAEDAAYRGLSRVLPGR